MSPTHQYLSNDTTFSQIKSRVPVPLSITTLYIFHNTLPVLDRSIWVPKYAELFADSKSGDKIEKKFSDKSYEKTF